MIFLVYIIGFLCAASVLHAEIHRDSTATRRSDTVVVTTSRTFLSVGENSTPHSTVPQEILTTIPMRQIDQALAFTPGITIQNYGGLGGLKTISMRGGNASQSIVAVDGIVINMTQTGMADLSTIPLSLIKNIEIQRGGGSALFGGNAMNGIVQIQSKISDTTMLTGIIGIGSFRELSAQTSVAVQSPLGNIYCSADVSRSRGDYPFLFNQFGEDVTLQRENGDFLQSAFSLRYNNNPSPIRIRSLSWFRVSDRGVPGAVLQGSVEQVASRLKERDIFSSWSFEHNLTDYSVVDGGFSLRSSTLRYTDPFALIRGPDGINETYNSHEINGFAALGIVSNTFLQQYRLKYSFADLQGTMIENPEGSYVKRVIISGSTRYHYMPDFWDSQWEFQAVFRGDYYSDVRFSPSALFSLSWKKFELCNVRSSVSFDFRPPNFNEMYYFNFGTRNLKPEYASTVNIGLFGVVRKIFSYELDIFTSRIEDKIIAVPTGPAMWSARNIANVINQGIELSLKSELFERSLLIHYTYSLQNPKDVTQGNKTLLPYIPQEILTLFTLVSLSDVSVGATFHHYSHRFSLGGNQRESLLPSYNLISSFVILKIPILHHMKPQLKLSCDNITDTQYVVIDNYPMPGRIIRCDMSFSL